MMSNRFNGFLIAALVLTLPSCNRGLDPVAKNPDNALKADLAEQKIDVKPKEAAPSEQDRLIEKAKALPPGKLCIELIRSAPAGVAGERVEYEWAILTRFPPRSEKLPKEEKKETIAFERANWIVVRMTMTVAVKASLEKDNKGKRFVNIRLLSSSISDTGKSNSGGQLITTKKLILSFDASGVFPVMLIGTYAFGEGGKQHAFAAKKAPLDELIVPLAKEARTIDLPYTLELARFGEEIIAVELITADNDAIEAIKKRGGNVITETKGLRVTLRGEKFTDADLEHVAKLPRVGFLALLETKITDAGLEKIKGLKELWGLEIYKTDVSDKGMKHLSGLNNLEGLYLGFTKVGDAGLAHLQGLKKLRGLVLIGTPVTDAGLAHVREMPNLGYVDLTQTKATPAGVADLNKARPKLKVVVGNYQP
jgi:hypothetical protein